MGFPQTIEEATDFYLTDPPPPPEGQEASPAKVVKASLAPDIIVVLSSSEESCLARFQEDKEITETEFGKRMARWKAENPEEGPGMASMFREKFNMEPLLFNVDEVSFDSAAQEIIAQLAQQRQVFNFTPPPRLGGEAQSNDQPTKRAATAQDE